MKLLDRIALHKLLTTIFSFIITVLKIIVPKTTDLQPERKIWKPRWRRDK